MKKEAVFHKINSNYSYVLQYGVLTVVLRVAKDDIERVSVVYYNRFDEGKKEELTAQKFISDDIFDYFKTDILLDGGSCVYYFEVTDFKGDTEFFGELGFTKLPPKRVGSFEMLALHKSEINFPPPWVYDSIFYQIFPDRFYRAKRDLRSGVQLAEWGQEPTYYSIFGGNIDGIAEKFDYIKNLGINAIYMTPVFSSKSCHRYDTVDYYAIDSVLGDKESVKEFVRQCHENGIRVVFDAVFNHCSEDFFAFKDVKERGEKSRYKDWFYIDGFPLIKEGKKNYRTFANELHMPRLNTENEEVADYFIEAAKFWTRELELDGWRLDVADEVCSVFWRRFRRELKKINPELFILGEVWHNGEYYLHNKFDSTMNYFFQDTVINCMFDDVDDFKNRITKQLLMYPYQYVLAQFNLIDSHDTARALYRLGEDKNKLKNAAVFQFCYSGVPCLYYGDEIALSGGDDPFNRRCMEWDESKADLEMLKFYCSLISLRKNNTELRRGDFRWEQSEGIAFSRSYNGKSVNIIINTDKEEISVGEIREILFSHAFDSGVLKAGGFIIYR